MLVVVLPAMASGLQACTSSTGLLQPRSIWATRAVPVMALGRSSVPEVSFASAYKPQEIAALWKVLQRCYGGEEAARSAVRQNAQVLCPLYASPSLLEQSYKSLVVVLGKEEALKIMAMNPMVLTCGSDLEALDPNEIRSAARTRQFLDKYVTAEGLGLVLIVAVFAIVAKLAAVAR